MVGRMMQNLNYVQAEANALVGKGFETLVEWDGVKKGARGRVVTTRGVTVRAVPGPYENYEVVFEWDPPHGDLTTRALPMQSWFSKFQMQKYMRELKG